MTAPHVQAQREIERVGVHNEIGDRKHEYRESGGARVVHRQQNPTSQESAYRKRRENRPCAPKSHAIAAANCTASGRNAGSRAYNSARTSLSSAMDLPNSAMIGMAL